MAQGSAGGLASMASVLPIPWHWKHRDPTAQPGNEKRPFLSPSPPHNTLLSQTPVALPLHAAAVSQGPVQGLSLGARGGFEMGPGS